MADDISLDPAYEFSAPQFCNFYEEIGSPAKIVDSWFGTKFSHIETHRSPVGNPGTICKTPKKSLGTPQRTGLTPAKTPQTVGRRPNGSSKKSDTPTALTDDFRVSLGSLGDASMLADSRNFLLTPSRNPIYSELFDNSPSSTNARPLPAGKSIRTPNRSLASSTADDSGGRNSFWNPQKKNEEAQESPKADSKQLKMPASSRIASKPSGTSSVNSKPESQNTNSMQKTLVKALTVPQSPKFHTTSRSLKRPRESQGIWSVEVQKAKEPKKNLTAASTSHRQITLAHPPKFATEDRARMRHAASLKDPDNEISFKLPEKKKSVLAKSFVAPVKKIPQITIPRSPAFTKPRVFQRNRVEQKEPPKNNPQKTKALRPQLHSVRPVKVIKQITDQSSAPSVVTQKTGSKLKSETQSALLASKISENSVSTSHLTQPKEFRFATDRRLALHKPQKEAILLKENKPPRGRTAVTSAPPSSSKPKALTNAAEFHFHSEDRLKKRKLFDESFAKKEEMGRRQIEEEKKVTIFSNKQMQIQSRKVASAFKAQPIKQYKSIEIRPSRKPLTEPVSPVFHSRKRIRL